MSSCLQRLYLIEKPFLTNRQGELIWILVDFSLTVKAATLIFISGRGSAISSA